jgi:hypothetical protein
VLTQQWSAFFTLLYDIAERNGLVAEIQERGEIEPVNDEAQAA